MEFHQTIKNGEKSRPSTTPLQTALSDLIDPSQRVCFLGIGSTRMGDDGYGPYFIYQFLFGKFQFQHPQVRFINGRGTPEDRIEEILDFRPDVLLIVDIIQSQSPPGTVYLLKEESFVPLVPVSSHNMPLQLFLQRLHEEIPSLDVFLLGIEPFSLDFLPEFRQFQREEYCMDDYEEHPDLPFFDFCLSAEMIEIIEPLVSEISEWLKEQYKSLD